MYLGLIISAVLSLACIAIPVVSHSQEVTVASTAKISDPTNTGAASAGVPIEVPPGRRGIAPNLTLSYSSNMGNTWLGMGWDISMGEIQRSTKRGVDYSSNEYIFLGAGGSAELVARPDWGANYYGSRIEGTFNKHYYNQVTKGWEVTSKDGTKYYYGTATGSRQENASGIFKWFLDKVQDINGNYMTVTYWKDQGELYLSRIDYTGNTNGLSTSNYVQFHLEPRPDAPSLYNSNHAIKTAYRLKTIEVVASGLRARAYKLTYTTGANTGVSLLASMQQYGTDVTLDSSGNITGGSALPAITFAYTAETTGYSSSAQWIAAFGNGDANRYRQADIDGDGRTDIIYIDPSGNIYAALSSGTGFGASTLWIGAFGNGDVNRYRMADFNADGKTDITYIDPSGNQYAALSSGTGFGASTLWIGTMGNGDANRYFHADFNGDGKADITYIDPSGNQYVALSSGTGFGASTLWLAAFGSGDPGRYNYADLNGDGLVDKIYIDPGDNIYAALSSGTGFGAQTLWIGSFGNGDPGRYKFADFNGDGKTDILYIDPSANQYIAISNGSSFINTSAWLTAWGNGDPGRYIPVDINADSRVDLTYVDPSGHQYVAYSNGTNLINSAAWLSGWGNADPGRYRVADLNGDGNNDKIYIAPDNNIHVVTAPWGAANKLAQINNGLGGSNSFTYVPSTAYANTMLPFVIQTVATISGNDGNGNVSTTSYIYSGGLFDVSTREFRGFAYEKQSTQDRYAETWYKQDDLYKGLPYDQLVKDSSGNIYTRAYSTYSSSTPYPGVSFPYLAQKDEYLYDGAQTYKQTAASFEYDSYGNLTRKYSWGNVSVTGDEKDEYIVYNYDPANWIMMRPSLTYLVDGNGNIASQTMFTYDSKGNVLSKTAWLRGGTSPSVSYTYDAYGNQKTIKDPRGKISTLEYDSTYIYVISTTNPLGHKAQVSYNTRLGKPVTKTDANGNTLSIEYDVFGRAIESTDPQSGTSAYRWKESYYDGFGRIIKTKTAGPDNKTIITESRYNDKGQVYATALPYFANSSGQPLETPRWTYYYYDFMGRLSSAVNPDGTTVQKSYMQGRTMTVDANGHAKVEEKDIYGRLIRVEEYEGTYPSITLYSTMTYTYDILGNLTKTTDINGNNTVMAYDTLGRKTSMTDPDMGYWTYQYDINGNLTSQTDAKNQKITFTYDDINRVKTKTYPNSSQIVYTYDETSSTNSKGRLTTVTDQSGSLKSYYDQVGRVTKNIKTIDSVAYTTETTYDTQGRTLSIKYPDGETVNYSYDAAGNLTGAAGYVTYSNYNALGQAGTITYANGVTTTHQYNPQNSKLTNIVTNNQTQGLLNLTYTYDNAGNIKSIADALDATRTQNFDYDHLNRLTQAQSPSYTTITYNYDKIGNITYNSQLGTYTYGTKPHAVLQAGPNSYTYDANGSMDTGAGRTITYDYDNRPATITKNGITASFVYDYSGQRIKKTASGVTTTYVSAMYECQSGVCTKYIFAGGTRIASKSTANTYYYHGDHLGSSSVITDATGAKVQELYYFPFGKTRLKTGSVDVKHKYTGQEEDPETGLYYYNARYYDPDLGRFITADTIIPNPADPQSFNRYSYVDNNPLRYTDPTGHFKFSSIWKAVASIAVAAVVTVATGGLDMPFLTAVLAGASAGATSAALNKGNILTGALTGAITGAAFYGAGEFIQGNGITNSLAKAGIHAAAGAAAGGINAAITGGNAGLGMLVGGLSGGIANYAGSELFGPGKLFPDGFGYQLGGRALIGGVVGGIAAEIYGGNFEDGLAVGAMTSALGYLVNEFTHELARGNNIIKSAKDWLGVPYRSSAPFDKNGTDCSHLVHSVYAGANLTYPYKSTSTFESLKTYFDNKTTPINGDVVLYKGHMGIYYDGKIISAQSGAGKVTICNLNCFSNFKGYYRFK